MKRWLILLALVLFGSALPAQVRYIDAGIFQVEYNEAFEQPQRLWYTVQCSESLFSRSGLNFRSVDSIHTSDNADYANNVWDKGHLAPAADFACDSLALRQTFSYLNCALQHESLNRGPWKGLEDLERQMAERGPVKVLVVVEFETSAARQSLRTLPTGAQIPTHFSKTIQQQGHSWTYRFPNDGSVKGKPYSSFLVSAD
jgi:DNA/RNA endonuclease G (NUC1)